MAPRTGPQPAAAGRPARLPLGLRHAWEAIQIRSDGREYRLAWFAVTAQRSSGQARETAENRCRAARAADPDLEAFAREINRPVRPA